MLKRIIYITSLDPVEGLDLNILHSLLSPDQCVVADFPRSLLLFSKLCVLELLSDVRAACHSCQ